uniref:Uncharacterized protein n=1 Tax=Rhizophora mucronata TaxID=61149 RepID=A0A2P2PT58_RHIMU
MLYTKLEQREKFRERNKNQIQYRTSWAK